MRSRLSQRSEARKAAPDANDLPKPASFQKVAVSVGEEASVMARMLAWGLVAAVALAPFAGCASPSPGSGTPTPSLETCDPVDQDWDYARVTPEPALLAQAVANADRGHAEVRAKAGLAAESPPPPRIRIFTWGSFLPGRYSLVATANAAGEWDVVKATEGREGGRLPPEAASVSRATVRGDEAAKLNKLVFERCLYAEPTYYGRTVPTKGGGEATCADGADYLIDIEVGGRRHRSFHACHTFGRPGEVAGIFWQATSE